MKKKEMSSELTSKGSTEDTLLLQPNANHSAPDMEREATGEIILYQPDETLSLQVKLDAAHDTVWLSTSQMSLLFAKEESTIRRHIINIFAEKELMKDINVHFLHVNGTKKPVPFYSLDVIISVGYRVRSIQGIRFRQWATRVLKQHLLNGYSVNQHLVALQQRIDSRFEALESRVDKQQEQLDFLVKTHSTPDDQLFPNGCVWDAYSYVSSLIRSAKEQVILIDNYVDETVLTLLDKRADGVKAVIHSRFSEGFLRELERHNAQYPPVEFVQFPHKVHDRFLIIDSQVYLLGNSLKDMGHTLSAAILTGFTVDEVLGKLK
ncbi:MAG: RhuM family protein [Bacteroidales bacterium]|nr:RhuM family protein [Bacteroidales bacterium]